MCDDKARVYVVKMKSVLEKRYPIEIDIFSNDGYYLYKSNLSYRPYIIKNGYLYARIANEETGEVFVKRYRIKNWDQIKTGL